MGKIRQKRFLFDILDRKKIMFFDLKSEIINTSEKSTFFFPKIRIFCDGYFFEKLSKKSLFFDALGKKECFLDQKSEFFKKSIKSKFSKGVSAWFLSKKRMFLIGIFWRIKSKKSVFLYSG